MTKRLVSSLIAAVTVAAVLATAASASCIRMTAAEQRARADVIFDGKALDGPTATGVQRFAVSGYLKGRGPAIARVNTGNVRRADGSGTTTSISLFVRRDERWRIFARGSSRRVLESNLCDGSRRR